MAKGKQPPTNVVTDERFKKLHTDHRFRRLPKRNKQIEIDERFSGLFDDPRFQIGAPVDKRGRKLSKGGTQIEDMRRFYRLKHEDDRKIGSGTTDNSTANALQERVATRVPLAKGPKSQLDTKSLYATSKMSKELSSSFVAELKDDKLMNGCAEDEKSGMRGQGGEAPGSDYQSNGSDSSDDLPQNTESERSSESEAEEGAEDAERWARARGLMGSSSSSWESSSSEGVSEDESEDVDQSEWGVGALAANPDAKVPEGEVSSRIAIVDLDWEHIKAVDILALLWSFLPKGGEVQRVTVYPSDYGLEKMKEDALLGPQGIYSRAVERGRDGEHEASRGTEVDKERLRAYEKSKLRYYYAVALCDSKATAAHIVRECDGSEFQHSSCRLDIRYVPDSMSFEGRQVRDTATDVPKEYEVPMFSTTALEKTNVELTWDCDDQNRVKFMRQKVSEDQLKDQDFAAYLASEGDEEEEAEDVEAIRRRYRALLNSSGGAENLRRGEKAWAAKSGRKGANDSGEDGQSASTSSLSSSGDDAGDMDMTFMPSLSEKNKPSQESEAVWQSYLNRSSRKKERLRAMGRMNVYSSSSGSEDDGLYDRPEADEAGDFVDQDDRVFDDPFFQQVEGADAAPAEAPKDGNDPDGNSGGDSMASSDGGDEIADDADDNPSSPKVERLQDSISERGKRQAELELLVLDDSALNAARRGETLMLRKGGLTEGKPAKGKVTRKERIRKKQMKAKRRNGSDEEDLGGADFEDPRFQALFTSADFAVDPTDPAFKRSQGMEHVMQEVKKRRVMGRAGGEGKRKGQTPSGSRRNGKVESAGDDLDRMVKKQIELSLIRKEMTRANVDTGKGRRRRNKA